MKFEIGKKYWYEIPTNPSWAVVSECKKLGTEPYRLYKTFEVIKRTNHFVILKKIGCDTTLKRKVKTYKDIEECCIAEIHHASSFLETIKANRLCKEEDQ